jgi:hypothetical protein
VESAWLQLEMHCARVSVAPVPATDETAWRCAIIYSYSYSTAEGARTGSSNGNIRTEAASQALDHIVGVNPAHLLRAMHPVSSGFADLSSDLAKRGLLRVDPILLPQSRSCTAITHTQRIPSTPATAANTTHDMMKTIAALSFALLAIIGMPLARGASLPPTPARLC